MNNNLLRITKVEIENIKNVKKGNIEFGKTFDKNNFLKDGDITGIYGQNGSGKIAFIDSMKILKAILLGTNLDYIYDMIHVESEKCKLKVHFYFETLEKKYNLIFEVEIKKYIDDFKSKKITLIDEIVKFTDLENDDTRMKTLIGNSTNKLLKNIEDFKNLIDKKEIDLKVAKKLSIEKSTTFLFSNEFFEIIKTEEKKYNETFKILEALKFFGIRDLIIITNENMGIINLNNNDFPLNLRTNKTVGRFIISDKNIVIDENLSAELQNVINQINTVIKSIIPNMSLELFESKKEIMDNGKASIVYQLLSIRGKNRVPFKNESDGIKKIVSILSALIGLYHNQNICLVIDELDSGIFEYLLGELLVVLSEGIKGQLIFTSHNLRILEKLNKECLVFSTTNETNRYLRLKNIKPSNNIRDFFIREIVMQEQKEKLYEETNNSDIDFSFYKAGEIYENK